MMYFKTLYKKEIEAKKKDKKEKQRMLDKGG